MTKEEVEALKGGELVTCNVSGYYTYTIPGVMCVIERKTEYDNGIITIQVKEGPATGRYYDVVARHFDIVCSVKEPSVDEVLSLIA